MNTASLFFIDLSDQSARAALPDDTLFVASAAEIQPARERLDAALRNPGQGESIAVAARPEYRPRFADFIGLVGVSVRE